MDKDTRKVLFKYFILPNERRMILLKKILKDRIKREDYENVQIVHDLIQEFFLLIQGVQSGQEMSENWLFDINTKYNDIILKELENGNIE